MPHAQCAHEARCRGPRRARSRNSTTGSEGREVSTTMAFVVHAAKNAARSARLASSSCRSFPTKPAHSAWNRYSARSEFISSEGQLYEPVDVNTLLYYKEAKDGQILEEGITEAGSMASFIAAGSAYATYGINTIPFFIYYSMFGFQRIGDLIWAAADMRCRGFLLGGTAGRTTLVRRRPAASGRQQPRPRARRFRICAPTIPRSHTKSPSSFEDGIRRMYKEGESIFYYITVMNEAYADAADASAKARRKAFSRACIASARRRMQNRSSARSFSAAARSCAKRFKAQEILDEKYGVAADVWSVTSYKDLYYDGIEAERWNLLHPSEKPRVPYVAQCLADAPGVLVAASDYLKALPNMISKWMPRRLCVARHRRLRPQRRPRRRCATSSKWMRASSRWPRFTNFYRDGKIERSVLDKAITDLGINPEKLNPVTS